ncbi:MAG: hypothetical protein K0S34_23 [Bacillales bacterium]|jgi:hypothetical protein|nr:hypothetical protein [Bacillales bacterium]
MPQKLSHGWKNDLGKKYEQIHLHYINTIGNLALTAYNPELSNKRFIEKKHIYIEFNIQITRNLEKYEQWDELSIKNRTEELTKIAKDIWTYPIEFETLSENDEIEINRDISILEDVNITGYKPNRLTICDEIHIVNSWKSLFKKLCLELYDLDRELFRTFIYSKDFEGRERRIIADSSDKMVSVETIDTDVYIETNLNANAILNYCKIISEKFNLQDDIYYSVR